MKTITEADLIGLVRARVTEADSEAHVARQLGVSRNTINMLLRGIQPPGVKVARALGYRRLVMYTKETAR